MGEECKKIEEAKGKKQEEKERKSEKTSEDGKKSEDTKADSSPPQEIVLRVFMHCEGCAKRVKRCLKDFDGVEDVITDCKSSKVVVRGEKADPLKVMERIQKKSHRRVELISPIPKPQSHEEEEPKKSNEEKEVVVKPPEKEQEPPTVFTVVLGIYMHCDACAQEIKKRILRMKGVESAEPDLKSSQVTVKGRFELEKLSDYVFKRTGKHTSILKIEPENKEEKEEKKPKETEKKNDIVVEAAIENRPVDEGKEPPVIQTKAEVHDPKSELRRNVLYYSYPQNYQLYPRRFVQEMNAYPPQMFSDENSNACYVM